MNILLRSTFLVREICAVWKLVAAPFHTDAGTCQPLHSKSDVSVNIYRFDSIKAQHGDWTSGHTTCHWRNADFAEEIFLYRNGSPSLQVNSSLEQTVTRVWCEAWSLVSQISLEKISNQLVNFMGGFDETKIFKTIISVRRGHLSIFQVIMPVAILSTEAIALPFTVPDPPVSRQKPPSSSNLNFNWQSTAQEGQINHNSGVKRHLVKKQGVKSCWIVGSVFLNSAGVSGFVVKSVLSGYACFSHF